MADQEVKKNKSNGTISTTVIIVLIALVSITAATIAWFSIADNTRLQNMKMGITTGYYLRFDLDPHDTYEDYCQTLSYEDIRERVLEDTGVDINNMPLEPVTTDDAEKFRYENGKESPYTDGNYYEFVLHFMATEDMNIHLSSADSEDGEDGTMLTSENAQTPYAMRVAFLSEDGTMVYDPGMTGESREDGKMTAFGLYPEDEMDYNESNMLFFAPANTDVPVTVRIWVEGTDEACNNNIKNSGYSLRMRFEGTDENFEVFGQNEED